MTYKCSFILNRVLRNKICHIILHVHVNEFEFKVRMWHWSVVQKVHVWYEGSHSKPLCTFRTLPRAPAFRQPRPSASAWAPGHANYALISGFVWRRGRRIIGQKVVGGGNSSVWGGSSALFLHPTLTIPNLIREHNGPWGRMVCNIIDFNKDRYFNL